MVTRPPGEIVVAYGGGVNSVALLLLLAGQRQRFGRRRLHRDFQTLAIFSHQRTAARAGLHAQGQPDSGRIAANPSRQGLHARIAE